MEALPTRLRRLLRGVLLFGVALGAGIGLGVALDRVWLRPTPAAAVRPDFGGRWTRVDNGTPWEFKPDGTYEGVSVTTISEGEKVLQKVERPHIGQWRWVEGDRLELRSPELMGAMQFRVVLAGDSLKLLLDNGEVREFRR